MSPPNFGTLTHRTDIYPAIDPSLFQGTFKGQTALVVGSGRGIGKAIAFAFAQAGANVSFSGRTLSEIEAAANECAAKFPEIKTKAFKCDVLKNSDLQALVDQTESALGPISIVVHSAGFNFFESFTLSESSDWWSLVELNVRPPVDLTRILLPRLIERKTKATFIYISSRAAVHNLAFTTAYNTGKAAIVRFTGTIQAELDADRHTRGLPINYFCLHPSEVHTSLHDVPLRPHVVEKAPDVVELMDFLNSKNEGYTPELPAWTSVFLASGKGDRLRGRYIDASRDIGEMMDQIDKIEKEGLYDMTVRYL